MSTREEIESDLMFYAQRANKSHDTSEYQEYINRMQLDLLMDIRELLTPPKPLVTLDKLQQELAVGNLSRFEFDTLVNYMNSKPI